MRRVKWLPFLMAAVLAAQTEPAVGSLVFPSVELEISAAPGMPFHGRLGASPALVLAAEGNWLRLLGANGVTGWAQNVVGNVVSPRVRAREMMTRSPDDPEFVTEAEAVAWAPGQTATVTGASKSSRVPSMDKMMLPEEINPFQTPWLRLQGGEWTGWQAPSLVNLLFSAPTEGLVRAPFLPREQAPRLAAGQPIWRFSDLRAKAARVASQPADFPEIELKLALPPARGQRLAELTVHAGASGRFFALRANRGTPIAILVESYPPVVTGFATADLDRDGANELLLEMVQTYGDGWFSTLWIVDGKSTDTWLQVAAVPLGGSGGEPGASRIEAAWWTEKGRLWIVRKGEKLEAIPARYGRGTLQASGGPAFAGVIARFRTRIEAGRTAWSAAKRLGRPVHVFRLDADWVAGILFTRLADAKDVPGAEVVPLPAGRQQ